MIENPVRRAAALACLLRPQRSRPGAAVAILALSLSLVVAACASAPPPAPAPPSPADLARLEAALARDTASAAARLALGAAYRAAGQPERALPLLERARAERPADASAVVELGLAYEDLGRFAAARDLYTRFIASGRPSAELRERLQARLPLLARRELQAAVRAALADERRLAGGAAPAPRTVAVFPLVYAGSAPALEPLGRALAELLVTDLSQSSRLRVLERARVQMLVDEMKLAERGLVDPATAARSGRLLGAGRVVQGSIQGDSATVRLEAAAVSAAAPRGERLSPVQAQDAVRRLFDVEKQVALGLFQSMGIQLTIAERERVMARPTANLEALLEFGRGLEAEDRGDFAAAAAHFRRAHALDTGFQSAGTHGARAASMALALNTPPAQLAAIAGGATVASRLDALQRLTPLEGMIPDPSVRDVGPEVLQSEGLGQPATVRIIIRRP